MNTPGERASRFPKAARIARARVRSALRLAHTMLSVFGVLTLIGAGLITLILSLFQLNSVVLFAGSVVALTIFWVRIVPLGKLYKSDLFLMYQEEGLWDLSEQTLYEQGGPAIEAILEGRNITDENSDIDLLVPQLVVLFIRKGKLREAISISEYQIRRSKADASDDYDVLACMYVEVGKFDLGLQKLLGTLDRLRLEQREGGPAGVSVHLGILHTYACLRDLPKAESWLASYRKTVDICHKTTTTTTDELVKAHASRIEVDESFYHLFAARVHLLKNEQVEAAQSLDKAITMMKAPELQAKLTLLYPELLIAKIELEIKRQDYVAAERIACEVLDYYARKTVYLGVDLAVTTQLLAYSRLKQGRIIPLEDLSAPLERIKSILDPIHPKIATALTYLAEGLIAREQQSQAIECLERALNIRRQLFKEGDAEILALENMLVELCPPDLSMSLSGNC